MKFAELKIGKKFIFDNARYIKTSLITIYYPNDPTHSDQFNAVCLEKQLAGRHKLFIPDQEVILLYRCFLAS